MAISETTARQTVRANSLSEAFHPIENASESGCKIAMNAPLPENETARRPMFGANDWFTWAILSALFAAMTAIFAKVGLKDVDSDYATLFRTFVIILVLAAFVVVAKKWRNPLTLSSHTVMFLVLSGLATGAS